MSTSRMNSLSICNNSSANGLKPGESARLARLRLGNTTGARETVYDMSAAHALATTGRHVRLALRSFRRRGNSYLFATAILSLGIELSVSMFS